ncbi:hypothetical protein D3C71_1370270 [compost metagenome]
MVQLGTLGAPRLLVRLAGPQQAQNQADRAQHQDADQLDHGAGLDGQQPGRGGGGQDLRHGVDGQAGQNADLGRVKAHQSADDGDQQDHGDAENGGEADGGGHVLALGLDHRGHGGDGGVAADGVAAGHQQGHGGRQAEGPAQGVAADDGQNDDADDGQQEDRPERHDGGARHGRAQQGHGDFQQGLGAELDAGHPDIRRGPEQADARAHQDGDDQALDPGVAEQRSLDQLQGEGDGADPGAQQNAGQETHEALQRADKAGGGVGGRMGGRHDAVSSAPASDRSNG